MILNVGKRKNGSTTEVSGIKCYRIVDRPAIRREKVRARQPPGRRSYEAGTAYPRHSKLAKLISIRTVQVILVEVVLEQIKRLSPLQATGPLSPE